MTAFDRIFEATEVEYKRFVANNRLLQMATSGAMRPEHYCAYLRETFHLIHHTPRILALAGARLSDDRRVLRNWFFEQTLQENGYDLSCIKDLKSLGCDVDNICRTQPGPGAWGLITQNYYMATYGNPIGVLGVATTMQGVWEHFGTLFANVLVSRYGLPASAVTLLRDHGGFDMKTPKETVDLLEFITEDEVADVIQARKMTFRHYGQLFYDVLSTTTDEDAPHALPMAISAEVECGR